MPFVDLHSHILWALDDGCQTADETLAAARLLVGLGWRESAPTPHAQPFFPSREWQACAERLEEAQALLDAEGVPLKLHPGAENLLEPSYLDRVDGADRRGLGATGRWALLELPFRASVPTLPDLLFRLARKGVRPLLAHPERCTEFERTGRAAEAVRLGAALQLNVGALADVYGRDVRKRAERFLDEGLYAVAATDLHHPAGADDWLAEALDALEKRAGAAQVERLCGENPRRVLAGEDLS